MRSRQGTALGLTAALLTMVWAAVPVSAQKAQAGTPAVSLPGTQVTVPWEQLRRLIDRRADTVRLPPDRVPPVPVVFDKILLQVDLRDSSVSCGLRLNYSVLTDSPWAAMPLLPSEPDVGLAGVILTKGDYVHFDGEVYQLIVSSQQKQVVARTLRCTWHQPVDAGQGMRSVALPLPTAAEVSVEVRAPAGFTSVELEPGLLRSTAREGRVRVLTYALTSPSTSLGLTYTPPPRAAPGATEEVVETVEAPRRITAEQEMVAFVSEERNLVACVMHLSVLNAPLREFRLRLPPGFTLLSLTAKGAGQWRIDSGIVRVPLTFDLEGDYACRLLGELPQDSVLSLPAIEVIGATSQTGRFAVSAAGAAEAGIVSMRNCVAGPPSEFADKVSEELSEMLDEAGKSVEGVFLAGTSQGPAFEVLLTVREHEAAAVVDAVADSALVTTALSRERKALTQALYLVRQRGRQFVTLQLPADAALWSVALDGEEVTPFKDDSGRVKVSLQRYLDQEEAGGVVTLDVLYFQDMGKRPGALRLTPCLPDMPVARLSWSVFYPHEWALRSARGDFGVSEGGWLAPAVVRVTRYEQAAQYERLQKYNAEAQSGESTRSALALPERPRHVGARAILLVDEQPRLVLAFMPAWVRAFATALMVLAMLAAPLGPVVVRCTQKRRMSRA